MDAKYLIYHHSGYHNEALALGEALNSIALMQDLAHVYVHGHSSTIDLDSVNRVCFALIAEIGELAAELHHKAWKPEVPMDEARRHRILKEYTDVIAFLGSLTNIVMEKGGWTADELAQAYQATHMNNRNRFEGRVAGHGTLVGRQAALVIGQRYDVIWRNGQFGNRLTYTGYSEQSETFNFGWHKGTTNWALPNDGSWHYSEAQFPTLIPGRGYHIHRDHKPPVTYGLTRLDTSIDEPSQWVFGTETDELRLTVNEPFVIVPVSNAQG